MSNSPLVNYTLISPNKHVTREHSIDTVTIHCLVGQLSVEDACAYFAKPETKAAPNYVIGFDGRYGMCVEEKDRSWCSSSPENDARAITIEVASDKTAPYAVTDAAYKALIVLLADICKRNGIKKLLWKGDKSLIGQVDKQNMTVHRWFKNKACPGQYLYDKHAEVANLVNARISSQVAQSPSQPIQTPPAPNSVSFTVRVNTALNIRQLPTATSKIVGVIKAPSSYTIVEVQSGWGKLKSGVGWINLSYTTRV